jgi:hypothetical protein
MAWRAACGWRNNLELEVRIMLNRLWIISAASLVATSLFAQGPGRHEAGDFALMRAEFGVAGKVVAGAPYSAQAVTQFTQTLASGDHIQRTMTASIARDSQGRTRVDRSISSVGALSATAGAQARAIMIHDTVAGVSYALNPATKTGTSMQIQARADRPAGAPQTRTRRPSTAAKTDDLGTQVIQGLSAQGKRVTRVIAAGQEGNEKEIDVVTETWYSPDLQVVIQSKTSDPRFGETVYQLSGLTRVEPDPALFTTAGYAITAGRARRGAAAPAAQ